MLLKQAKSGRNDIQAMDQTPSVRAVSFSCFTVDEKQTKTLVWSKDKNSILKMTRASMQFLQCIGIVLHCEDLSKIQRDMVTSPVE